MIIHVQIKKTSVWDFKDEKPSLAPLGPRLQDGSPIRLREAHVHANVTLCE